MYIFWVKSCCASIPKQWQMIQINIGAIKVAFQQGQHVFEAAGPTVKLPASGQRASVKIEHWSQYKDAVFAVLPV